MFLWQVWTKKAEQHLWLIPELNVWIWFLAINMPYCNEVFYQFFPSVQGLDELTVTWHAIYAERLQQWIPVECKFLAWFTSEAKRQQMHNILSPDRDASSAKWTCQSEHVTKRTGLASNGWQLRRPTRRCSLHLCCQLSVLGWVQLNRVIQAVRIDAGTRLQEAPLATPGSPPAVLTQRPLHMFQIR